MSAVDQIFHEKGPFTARELCIAVEREIGMRQRVYPRWVQNGKMKQAEATRQIAMFEQIRDEYAAKVQADEKEAEAEAAKGRLL